MFVGKSIGNLLIPNLKMQDLSACRYAHNEEDLICFVSECLPLFGYVKSTHLKLKK